MKQLRLSGSLAVLAVSMVMQPFAAFAQVAQTSYTGTQTFTGQFMGLRSNMLTLGIADGTRAIFVPSTLTVGQTFGDPLALSALTIGSSLRISCAWDPTNKYYVATSIALVDTDFYGGTAGLGYDTLGYGAGSTYPTMQWGGSSYGFPGYGGYGSYGYGSPCCTQPAYPYSNSALFANNLNAYNALYDFDTVFANQNSVSNLDRLNAFNANSRNIAADTINRVSDTIVKVDREQFSKFDQWKNVEIIRINEGVSKSQGSRDSYTLRDYDAINDAHYRDNAAAVSNLDTARAFDVNTSSQGATSVNQNANVYDADTLKKNLSTGYLY